MISQRIAEKLGLIQQFLGRRNIVLQVTKKPTRTVHEIDEATRTLGYPIPEELGDIYIHFADGFEVFWEETRSPTDFDFARFILPDLDSFVRESVRFHEQTQEFLKSLEADFDRPEEARIILENMLKWGVLEDTGGDGDLVCIDLESGAIIFHEREWMFHEPYANGSLIASGIGQLIEEWGNVCFLWFPGCPGHCPAPGSSAIPDYASQKFNLTDLSSHLP